MGEYDLAIADLKIHPDRQVCQLFQQSWICLPAQAHDKGSARGLYRGYKSLPENTKFYIGRAWVRMDMGMDKLDDAIGSSTRPSD